MDGSKIVLDLYGQGNNAFFQKNTLGLTCKEVLGEIRGTASSSNQIDIKLNFQKPTVSDYENSAPPLFEINEENLNANGQRNQFQFQAEAFNLFGWSKAPITTEPTEWLGLVPKKIKYVLKFKNHYKYICIMYAILFLTNHHIVHFHG